MERCKPKKYIKIRFHFQSFLFISNKQSILEFNQLAASVWNFQFDSIATYVSTSHFCISLPNLLKPVIARILTSTETKGLNKYGRTIHDETVHKVNILFKCWSVNPVYNSSVQKLQLSLKFPPDFTHIHTPTYTQNTRRVENSHCLCSHQIDVVDLNRWE